MPYIHPIPAPNSNFDKAVFPVANLHVFYVPIRMNLTCNLVAVVSKRSLLATAFEIIYFYS